MVGVIVLIFIGASQRKQIQGHMKGPGFLKFVLE
jgi:hypothetical protein